MRNLKILIKHLKGSIWKSQIQYLTFFLIACIVCFSSSPSCNREKYTSLSGTPMPRSPPHCPEPPKSAKTIKPREGDSVGRSGPHVTAPGPSLPAERAMSRPHSGRFPGCHGTIRTEGDSGDPGKGAGRRWGSSPALSLQPPSSEGPPQCTSHGCGLSAAGSVQRREAVARRPRQCVTRGHEWPGGPCHGAVPLPGESMGSRQEEG